MPSAQTRLEVVMQRELNSSLLAANAGDLSKGTHVLDVVTRIAVVCDIEDVECVRPEAKTLAFGNVKVLERRGIDLRIAWRSLGADARGPEGVRNLRPIGTDAIVHSIAGRGGRIGAEPVCSAAVNNLEPPILISASSAKGVCVADIGGRERERE